MLTTIEAVAAYLPPTVPIESLREELGLEVTEMKMYRRYFGLAEVTREPGIRHADLLLAAASKLAALHGREQHVRHVVYARALPAAFPYPINPVTAVRDALNLRSATCFSVTQHACAMALFAVDLCGRLLAAEDDPAALALLLTGEPAVSAAVGLTPGTTIMGEGAAAVLVGRSPVRSSDGAQVLATARRTYGEFNCGLTISDEIAERYIGVYTDALLGVITGALDSAGLTLDDVDLILPHNVNRVSWVRFCKEAGLPVPRVFLDNVPATGHCFGADPFLNFVRANELGLLVSGGHYVLTSVGRGSTFAAMVIEKS